MGKIKKIDSMCESVKQITEKEALKHIEKWFCEAAYLYAVLDFAVVLGIYEQGILQIGLGEEGKLSEIPWEYLQELRVFNEENELRLVRTENFFTGSLRYDGMKHEPLEQENPDQEYYMDEVQKLWGEVKEVSGIDQWSLLSSRRGSRLLVPVQFEYKDGEHKEIGLRVRRYFSFPAASKGNGLIEAHGERLLGLARWPE